MAKVNAKMANEIMDVMRKYDLEEKLSSNSEKDTDEAMNEFLSVLIATSSRVSAAYLMNKIRTTENTEMVGELAGNMISMVAYNYELALTAELAQMLEKIEALAEKEARGGSRMDN